MKIKIQFVCCLLLSFLTTSCSSNSIVTADVSDDFYNYSIGVGETVYARFNSYAENEELCDFIDTHDWPDSITINSIKLDDGTDINTNVLSFTNNNFLDYLDITCLKSFDEEIKIDKVILDFDDTLVSIKYNIELTFNPDYTMYPAFPIGYPDQSHLGNNFIDECSLFYSGKTFYLIFSKFGLGIDDSDSYIVNSLVSNNELFSLSDVKYAAIPSSSSVYFDPLSIIYFDVDIGFVDFEQIDLVNFDVGYIVQFNISYDEANVLTVGGDVKFNIEVNGDSYDVLYHIYYSTYGIY